MTMMLSLASPYKRLGAYLLDSLFVTFPFLTTFIVFGYLERLIRTGGDPDLKLKVQILMGFLLAGFYLVWCIYNCIWLHKDGQTLGKKLLSIRTVRTSGERAELGRLLLLRGGSTVLFGFVPFGFLVDHLMIFGENNQTLHDRVADTFVVDVEDDGSGFTH